MSLLQLICVAALLLIICTVFSKERDEHWGDISDYQSVLNRGYSLDGTLGAITREMMHKHLMVIASSGAGKTRSVVIPSLFTAARGNNSFLVLDPSGEIFFMTSGYLLSIGYIIRCINLLDNTDGFNCFAYFKSIDDIDRTAEIIFANSELNSGQDKYWAHTGQIVLSTFMQYCFFHVTEEYQNMANVLRLIEVYTAEPSKIDRLFVQAKDERLMTAYKSINALPERVRLSVVSMTLTALKIFRSPGIAKATSFNTVSFEEMRNTRTIIYLSIPLNQINFCAPITALIYQFAFQSALARIPDKGEASICCILDEAMSMRISDLPTVLSQGRKYSLSTMLILQHEQMGLLKYSAAEFHTIKNNCFTKIYMQGQAHDSCQQIQDMLGKVTVLEEGKERRQYLMEASEIRTLKEAIIFIGAEPPLRVKMTPVQDHFLFSTRTKMEPYELTRKVTYTNPPLLQLS